MNKKRIEKMFPTSVVTMETTDVFSVKINGAKFCNIQPLEIWKDDEGKEWLNVSYKVDVAGNTMCEGKYALDRSDLEEQLKRLNAALINTYFTLYGDETTGFSIDQAESDALLSEINNWLSVNG